MWDILFVLVIIPLAIAPLAFWLWMLVDCLTYETTQGNEKLLWALVIVFVQFIGAGLYYFIRRPERRMQLGY